MPKDRLFLLKPDFRTATEGPCYCPACASVEGLLSFYPRLREALDVQYLDFPRPRPAVIAELGEENQGLPVLVIHSAPGDAPLDGLEVRTARGRRFIQNVPDIGRYLARTQGIGTPH